MSLTSFKGLLFDLDNTLFSWNDANRPALEQVYKDLQDYHPIPQQEFRQLHAKIRLELSQKLKNQAASHNRIIFFKKILESLNVFTPQRALELFNSYWKYFFQNMKIGPSSHEVLQFFKNKGLHLVLISNHTTDIQLQKISRLQLGSYFDLIVTSEEAGCEKPDPSIFEQVLDTLDLKPNEVVMIGDNVKADIQGAQNVGISTILTTEFTKVDNIPGHLLYHIRHLNDLLDLSKTA